MMKAEVNIQAGICNFRTKAIATSDDEQFVTIKIKSDCDKIIELAKTIEQKNPLDSYQELLESQILRVAAGQLKGGCAACLVPTSIFKAMQVAARLSLLKDIEIKIQRVQN
ncbi:MAG TPA: hypothetical protein ENN22_07645 [bacterium]|nr:hypothetical protein [bacterium]